MRPFYFYKPLSFIQLAKFIKHFKLKWNTDERFFYEVFLNFPLVDIKLSIDEKYVSKHSKFHWLPDVFHRYAENLIQSEKSGERTWIEKLNCFKEKNKEKFLFLYFGTAQHRRGYDTLLHLAVKTNGCFIHCGLKNNNENFDYDINNLRCLLIKNGCLLETDEYITDPLTINHFFKSVSHLILPYKNFYGSSGVMLQALEFGIPVLTPDSGIIGYRTSKYNLGMTYEDSNVSSLEAQFLRFKKMDPKFFEKNIQFYMNLQSTEQLKKILTESFELPNHAQSKSKLTQ
jgi:hypothetical protein